MYLYRISYKGPDDEHWTFCDAISSKQRVLSSAKGFHTHNPAFEVIAEEEDWDKLSEDKYDYFMENDEHEGFGVEFSKSTGLKMKSGTRVKILSLLPEPPKPKSVLEKFVDIFK